MKAIMISESENITINFKKLYKDSMSLLQTSPFNAGIDLYTHRFEEFENYIKVYSGIAVQNDSNFYFMLAPRSSIYKSGLIMHNSIGIIDKNYTGEIIGIFNKTKDYKGINIGDRLMQLVPQKHINIELDEVTDFIETDRGSSGFGSTGK